MNWPVRVVRLATDPRERGLFCDAEGLSLAGHPLMEKTETGFEPRTVHEIQAIFDSAYGQTCGLAAPAYVAGLASVARSLNKGDLPLAMIGSLMLKLPEVSIAAMNDASDTTSKEYNPQQPRDDHGRWSRDSLGASTALLTPAARVALENVGRGAIRRLAPEVMSLLARLAVAAPGPVVLAAGVLVPFNRSNITEGEFPGFPGLNYRSDEGIVTISRLDAAGNIETLYRGLPDQDGFYHDKNGLIIGQHVGTGVLFDSHTLSELSSKQGDTKEPKATASDLPDASPAGPDDEPRVCPPITPENIAGRSARALAYQSQITGLPIGFDMLYRGVRFDGCDETTKRMQEAKGLMAAYLLRMSKDDLRSTPFYKKIMDQAERQNVASAGRGVDWYFADKDFADFFEREFSSKKLLNIKVRQRDAIVTKIEDCIALVKAHFRVYRLIHVGGLDGTLSPANIERAFS